MPDLQIHPTPAGAAPTALFRMGTARHPSGGALTVDSHGLRLDGEPWTPVMGEVHYARLDPTDWRDELLKMRAGGIGAIATYVFWIHHEEREGVWDWSGRRDLRRFVETCRDLQLPAIVRLGPWCHGEVRHGGLPDWSLRLGKRSRTDDSEYLGLARTLYQQIAAQLRGLLWKDGGPVIGVQVENEYGGPAEHLLTLKRLAIEAGLDVPLYTRTGWPALETPMPFGELLPLHGAYAEGFWDRTLDSMPGKYHQTFRFSNLRDDSAIATDHFGQRDAAHAEADAYPYLTCELGGGMMNSYHRRIRIDPRDVEAAALVKLGSGSALLGYYMYHGGANPRDALTTLHEHQATAHTNYNDLPTINYDFQAPLGSFGQTRPHFDGLRRLHAFIDAHGKDLAAMSSAFPPLVEDRQETASLRWSYRSDAEGRGFLFVNNHQRSTAMPTHRAVRFAIGDRVRVPLDPIDVPAGASFVWPVNLPLRGSATLRYATAQPLCSFDADEASYHVFAETQGVPGEFCITSDGSVCADHGTVEKLPDDTWRVRKVPAGRGVAVRVTGVGGAVLNIVLLSRVDADCAAKLRLNGRPHLLISEALAASDGSDLRLFWHGDDAPSFASFPPLAARDLSQTSTDHLFAVYGNPQARPTAATARLTPLHPPSGKRKITIGVARVAEAPGDADFLAHAAAWTIAITGNVGDALLRIDYVGDVARVYCGDELILDDFYNGAPFDVSLRDVDDRVRAGTPLTLRVLPLQPAAPIFVPPDVRARLDAEGDLCDVRGVALVARRSLRIDALPAATRPTPHEVSR